MYKHLKTLCLLLIINSIAQAKDLGIHGNLYDIAEPNALQEIEHKVAQHDWQQTYSKIQSRFEGYQPHDLKTLPIALQSESYLVDMSYAAPFDVPDGKGGIIYPKGYLFNPLDFIRYPNILIIIDGSDESQLQWFESSPYREDLRTKLLITGGSYVEVSHRLKQPVFYLTQTIQERFALKAVPSVLWQEGNQMRVQVVGGDL